MEDVHAQPLRLAVNGADGRTGSRVCAIARANDRVELAASWTHDSDTSDDVAHLDLVIDFSTDSGTRDAVRRALRNESALLVGTTSLSRETVDGIEQLAESQPVMIAPNLAFGVQVLVRALEAVAGSLASWDTDLIESHHHTKRDAPSGTALRLRDVLSDHGVAVPESSIHSLRTGDVVGEHTVVFGGPGEQIMLSHRATTRDVFAHGALRAGVWLVRQPPGLHTLASMLDG